MIISTEKKHKAEPTCTSHILKKQIFTSVDQERTGTRI
jgi:hypothetical protein